MPKVKILLEQDDMSDNWCGVEITLDGKKIASGCFGGEPEDNSRFRTYDWVLTALQKLSKELGAEVEVVEVDGNGDVVE